MGRRTEEGRKQGGHRPHEDGPRLFQRSDRGPWWYGDLRPWDGKRRVLRDPSAPNWPKGGDRTKDKATARRWSWEYVEWLEERKRRKREGLPPDFRTLGDAVDAYLRRREGLVEDNTLASDHTALRQHLLPWLGEDAPLEEFTAGAMQRLADERVEEGYAPGTLETYFQAINGLYRWLDFGTLWDTLDLPDRGQRDVHVWSDDELEELRDAADWVDEQRRFGGPSARLALEAALGTGARVSELFALRWSDFDLDGKRVRITRQVRKDRKEFKALKGKRGRNALVLPEFWDHHQPDAKGLLLPGKDGGPHTTRTHRRLIRRILDSARLNAPGVGWHSLRHTYARQFVERGGRLEFLQKSLGHASIRTTENKYGHLREDVAIRQAAGRIYEDRGLEVLEGGAA